MQSSKWTTAEEKVTKNLNIPEPAGSEGQIKSTEMHFNHCVKSRAPKCNLTIVQIFLAPKYYSHIRALENRGDVILRYGKMLIRHAGFSSRTRTIQDAQNWIHWKTLDMLLYRIQMPIIDLSDHLITSLFAWIWNAIFKIQTSSEVRSFGRFSIQNWTKNRFWIPFEIWTIQRSVMFRPLEYWTILVLESPILSQIFGN